MDNISDFSVVTARPTQTEPREPEPKQLMQSVELDSTTITR